MIDPNPDSKSNLDLVRSWLEHCISNHPDCPGSTPFLRGLRSLRDDPEQRLHLGSFDSRAAKVLLSEDEEFLPTRLIDVGSGDEASQPRLCVRNEVVDDKRYLTLSHCWGIKPMPLRTLKSTLDQYRTRLPMDLVPLTFSQAIDMTRKLGVRYLWIDSLCIIQDSEEDWLQESSVMGSIYSNSTCTLAASASSDSNGGLFGKRDQRKTSPCILSFPSNAGVSEGFLIHSPFSTLPDEMYELALYQDPLPTRGWVMQEAELSPRTIHFSTDQLIWRCWSQHACEARPVKAFSPSLNQPKFSHSYLVDALHKDESSDPFVDWYTLISDYATKKLTFDKDRLPAISALARKWQKLTGDRYVTGLWEGDLRRGLCWSRWQPNFDGSQRDRQYRAPSWSWVCMNSPCHWPYEILQASFPDELHILDVSLDPAGFDSFGQLSGGYLKLSGHARWVSEGLSNGGVLSQILNGAPLSCTPQWEFKTVLARRLYTGKGVVDSEGSYVPEQLGLLNLDYWDDLKNGIAQKVLLLKMAEEKRLTSTIRGNIFALALIDVGRYAATGNGKERAESGFPNNGLFFVHQPELPGHLVEGAFHNRYRTLSDVLGDHEQAVQFDHVFRRIGYAIIDREHADWFDGVETMEITVI
jgi:hypothetical protein